MSIFNNWPVNGANPATVGGTGITAKYFTYPSGNFTSGTSTTPSSSSAVGQLTVPGDSVLNGQRFSVIAAGDFEVGSGGACPNVLIELVANTGTTTSPAYTAIANTGQVTAQTSTSHFYPWWIEANIIGTTGAGVISGNYSVVVDNTVENSTPKALDSVLSGLSFATFPVFGLVVRVTFSVSESGNSANLYQFQLSSQ